ncbi:hypothetical protein FN846DRAFT_920156 [Sphaerosporella brunnea]|uniref:Uncharacterized protein n=1 Tax=Sphaerosporella brunnea TaxID=1250544 RepID=A0A5J5ESK8_9PEZI|nr:hypothetical protein FN846DRAFT_920156 [Sphaerosporella brunnea]
MVWGRSGRLAGKVVVLPMEEEAMQVAQSWEKRPEHRLDRWVQARAWPGRPWNCMACPGRPQPRSQTPVSHTRLEPFRAGDTHRLGTDEEGFDAEVSAICRAVHRFNERLERDQACTISADAQAALKRCKDGSIGPDQWMAHRIVKWSREPSNRGCSPAHQTRKASEACSQARHQAVDPSKHEAPLRERRLASGFGAGGAEIFSEEKATPHIPRFLGAANGGQSVAEGDDSPASGQRVAFLSLLAGQIIPGSGAEPIALFIVYEVSI